MENKYVMGFWVWVLIMMLAMLAMGCGTEYEKGWAWGVVTEDGMETGKLIWKNKEVRVDSVEKTAYGDDILIPDNSHKLCKNKHYHDPYTKFEYCLPENFRNMNTLHLYRVTHN